MTIFFWRLLRYSPVFRWWYEKFLNELLFDFETFDIDPQAVKDKYLGKLQRCRNGWRTS